MANVTPLRYDDYADVHRRLHKTIIRYKGEPYYAYAIPGSLDLTLYPLNDVSANSKRKLQIHSSDEDLDISSIPLGYLNYKDSAFYLQRIPSRKQQQGFSSFNAHIIPESDTLWSNNQWNSIFASSGFKEMINNQYLQGMKVLEILRTNKVSSMAFHRKFCLVKDDIQIIKLRHLTKTIGWFPPKKDVCTIPTEFGNEIFEKHLTSHGFTLA